MRGWRNWQKRDTLRMYYRVTRPTLSVRLRYRVPFIKLFNMKKIEIGVDEFIAICTTADSMADAAKKTGMHPTTFRRKAK